MKPTSPVRSSPFAQRLWPSPPASASSRARSAARRSPARRSRRGPASRPESVTTRTCGVEHRDADRHHARVADRPAARRRTASCASARWLRSARTSAGCACRSAHASRRARPAASARRRCRPSSATERSWPRHRVAVEQRDEGGDGRHRERRPMPLRSSRHASSAIEPVEQDQRTAGQHRQRHVADEAR